jgi:hypothetical protein
MPTGRSLGKHLEDFVRYHAEYNGEWMEETFTWLPELLRLAQSEPFAQFQWLALHARTRVRILGIRPELDTPFLSLTQFEADGFCIETLHHGHGLPADVTTNRYWIAELVSTNEVRLLEGVHVPPASWHVLDEHVLTRPPPDLASGHQG